MGWLMKLDDEPWRRRWRRSRGQEVSRWLGRVNAWQGPRIVDVFRCDLVKDCDVVTWLVCLLFSSRGCESVSAETCHLVGAHRTMCLFVSHFRSVFVRHVRSFWPLYPMVAMRSHLSLFPFCLHWDTYRPCILHDCYGRDDRVEFRTKIPSSCSHSVFCRLCSCVST